MKLSEREKRYVLLLAVLMLMAAVYYFYTAAVEPFLIQKAEMTLELSVLTQQEQMQKQKLAQYEGMSKRVETKTIEAMEAVKAFYPALPQDRLLLQLQKLLVQTGMKVKSIQYTGTTIAEPGILPSESVPVSYSLKSMAEIAAGKASTGNEGEVAATEEAAQVISENAIPQTAFSFEYEADHATVAKFIAALEDLDRTHAITMLREERGEEGLMGGSMTLVFYAVEKPSYDPFMDWPLDETAMKAELFNTMYADTVDEMPAVTP